MKNLEHEMQTALFRWAGYSQGKYPDLKHMRAIPNGGHRNISVACKLKAEGVKAGALDIMLPCPRAHWHGLFAEAKIKPKKPSPEQAEEINYLRKQGYYVFVFYDLEYAIEMITKYLNSIATEP
jgi:hypothetical protein